MRTVLFGFSRFPFAPVLLPIMGGETLQGGIIEIVGHIHNPHTLPSFAPSSGPSLVLRDPVSDTLVAASPLDYAMSDTSCWDNPIGCPFAVVMSGVAFGTYTLALEVQDSAYRRTRGTSGQYQVVAYYAGASTTPGGSAARARPGAKTVTISPASPHVQVILDV